MTEARASRTISQQTLLVGARRRARATSPIRATATAIANSGSRRITRLATTGHFARLGIAARAGSACRLGSRIAVPIALATRQATSAGARAVNSEAVALAPVPQTHQTHARCATPVGTRHNTALTTAPPAAPVPPSVRRRTRAAPKGNVQRTTDPMARRVPRRLAVLAKLANAWRRGNQSARRVASLPSACRAFVVYGFKTSTVMSMVIRHNGRCCAVRTPQTI